MKRLPAISKTISGFTLVELMVVMVIEMSMLAALLYCGMSMQRSFYASDEYSLATNDQLRAIDYITRDLRCALTVSIPNGGQTLNLTLPDCYSSYDAQGNPTSAVVNPTLSKGTAIYANPAKPISVSYYVSNQSIIRQQTVGATSTTTSLVIANDVENFQLNFQQLTNLVAANLTFTPKFIGSSATTVERQGTTVSATVSVRNLRLQ